MVCFLYVVFWRVTRQEQRQEQREQQPRRAQDVKRQQTGQRDGVFPVLSYVRLWPI